jgi:hypothetical protein
MRIWEDLFRSKIYMENPGGFYVRLTGMLREYLEERLKIPAKESVTPRLMELLETFRFENGERFVPADLDVMREMLRRADLSKFAKIDPLPVYREKDLQFVKDFISRAEETIRRIEEEKHAREEAERQRRLQQIRKRRRIYGITAVSIILLAGIIVYRYYKTPVRQAYRQTVLKWQHIPPFATWKETELGSVPSLAFRFPDVPEPDDTYSPPDSLRKNLEEYAFYKGNAGNLHLFVWIWDLKENRLTDVWKAEIRRSLKTQGFNRVEISGTGEKLSIKLSRDGTDYTGKLKFFTQGKKVRVWLW